MKQGRYDLHDHRDLCLELSAEELLGCVELAHGPDAGDHNTAIRFGYPGHAWVLLYSHENLLRACKDDNQWNHEARDHEATAIVVHAAGVSHAPPILLRLVLVFARAKCLRDERLERTVHSLHGRECEHIDKHIAHAYAGNQD